MPKSIFEILKEDITPSRVVRKADKKIADPSGDRPPGYGAGKADALVKSIQQGTRSLGFSVDDLSKQKTIAQLAENEFEFNFSIFWPKNNPSGKKK